MTNGGKLIKQLSENRYSGLAEMYIEYRNYKCNGCLAEEYCESQPDYRHCSDIMSDWLMKEDFIVKRLNDGTELIFKKFQTDVSNDDIDRLIEEQADFSMCIPPMDNAIYTNQWGSVIMNVKTLDKLLKVYRGEA